MGRKKKSANISYKDIIASSYMRKTEYEKAQTMFSAAIDSNGEGDDCEEDDFSDSNSSFQKSNGSFFFKYSD
jgi:hypothetical protein